MNRKFVIIAILTIVLVSGVVDIFGMLATISSPDNSLTTQKIVSDYREALTVIVQNYIGKINHEKITESSVQSMLWSLDPHSSFFTRAEFRKLYEEQASQFY